jgi:hypothetical protein
VLQIVRRWSVDMGLLQTALADLAGKPTLLIWGDLDRTVGLTSGRQLQRTLPQSSLIVIPGVGHIPFEELPDVCNKAMRDWLSSPLPKGFGSPTTAVQQRQPYPFLSHAYSDGHSIPPAA